MTDLEESYKDGIADMTPIFERKDFTVKLRILKEMIDA
jgi:hypothetical protein